MSNGGSNLRTRWQRNHHIKQNGTGLFMRRSSYDNRFTCDSWRKLCLLKQRARGKLVSKGKSSRHHSQMRSTTEWQRHWEGDGNLWSDASGLWVDLMPKFQQATITTGRRFFFFLPACQAGSITWASHQLFMLSVLRRRLSCFVPDSQLSYLYFPT